MYQAETLNTFEFQIFEILVGFLVNTRKVRL